MNYKETIEAGYNAIAKRHLPECIRNSTDYWSKYVSDESLPDAGHLFVLVQK